MIVINESNWADRRSRVQLYDIHKLTKQIRSPQPAFICSKKTMETPEQCMKSVQS